MRRFKVGRKVKCWSPLMQRWADAVVLEVLEEVSFSDQSTEGNVYLVKGYKVDREFDGITDIAWWGVRSLKDVSKEAWEIDEDLPD